MHHVPGHHSSLSHSLALVQWVHQCDYTEKTYCDATENKGGTKYSLKMLEALQNMSGSLYVIVPEIFENVHWHGAFTMHMYRIDIVVSSLIIRSARDSSMAGRSTLDQLKWHANSTLHNVVFYDYA